MQKENSVTVKLIEPASRESSVHNFALRGGGLHHLCFRCNNVLSEVARLESLGMRQIACPQPGEAFDNNNIDFVYAPNMGLNLELIDTDIKAARLDRQ